MAFSADELQTIRALLRAVGFVRLGRAFRKAGRQVQPLYGKAAVTQFLTLIGGAAGS